MVVHFNITRTVSGRPEDKEKTAELMRRLREQEAEDAKNPDRPKIIVRRAS